MSSQAKVYRATSANYTLDKPLFDDKITPSKPYPVNIQLLFIKIIGKQMDAKYILCKFLTTKICVCVFIDVEVTK